MFRPIVCVALLAGVAVSASAQQYILPKSAAQIANEANKRKETGWDVNKHLALTLNVPLKRVDKNWFEDLGLHGGIQADYILPEDPHWAFDLGVYLTQKEKDDSNSIFAKVKYSFDDPHTEFIDSQKVHFGADAGYEADQSFEQQHVVIGLEASSILLAKKKDMLTPTITGALTASLVNVKDDRKKDREGWSDRFGANLDGELPLSPSGASNPLRLHSQVAAHFAPYKDDSQILGYFVADIDYVFHKQEHNELSFSFGYESGFKPPIFGTTHNWHAAVTLRF